ncbi:hypothetical protein K2224_17630 [Streptomyces sp. BHT-5-2]|uniref:hypothetical protein n=1 Tax=Streptomyces sp. BHT-5-2 TaxID=2866715 RepID=UPI001C8D87BB|nr:hypothetical protein [Streptomyces sp. BHT-5-2]QZL04741.1 hypothetical protein K2224_17630 [Streptomyces sp. BHT-5-2]
MGTATGFNAALLCALLGDQAVTTIELDTAPGREPDAPCDLILATFSVDRLPPAWRAQSAPGGRIITRWNSAWCCYGTLALTTHHDGSTTSDSQRPTTAGRLSAARASTSTA